MHYPDIDSWRIVEDEGSDLTAALYVRDALALQRWDDSVAVPSLEPSVDLDQRWGRSVDERIAGAWSMWWWSLLDKRRAAARTEDSRIWIRATNTSAELGALLDLLLDPAYRWADERKLEHINRFRQQTRSERLLITQIVHSVEESLDRPARPFSLAITTLPVKGVWSYRVSDDALLASVGLRNDATKMRDLLVPIMRAVA